LDELLEKIDDELYVRGKNFDGQICQEANWVKKAYLFKIENQSLKCFLDIHSLTNFKLEIIILLSKCILKSTGG
jgi:hypothetical protein